MSLATTVERVKSGVISINFISAQNQMVAKGTGFMCRGLLVTNNHVFQGPDGSRVWLRRFSDSEDDPREGLLIPIEQFRGALRAGSDPALHDYAVLDIGPLRAWGLHNFMLRSPELRIGDQVAFLGYPLDHMNLTCHAGVVSSLFTRNRVDNIQVDASVNASNSGGPLILPETGEAVGIITRKATGLTSIIGQLRSTVQANIRVVEGATAGGSIALMGIDPLKAFKASQVQVMNLLSEIERSANVGIGYAFSARHLLEDNLFHSF
jgi:S1-C subfamily serine protease